MTNTEIIAWLEWFHKNIDAASKYSNITGFAYQYEFEDETLEIAYELIDEKKVVVDRLLQIALQEEIRKLKDWNLEMYQNNDSSTVLIRCPAKNAKTVIKQFDYEAGTILEAMMKAFREAYEAVNQ